MHVLIPGREEDTFGLGYFYENFSDVLQDSLSPSIQLTDEQGVEAFYNLAGTKWMNFTLDVQYIATGRPSDNCLAIALRTKVRF
jgi:porin